MARRGVLGLPALLRDRGAGRAQAPRRLAPRCPPAPIAGATCEQARRRATGSGSLPTMLGSMVIRDFVGHPHDVGSDQRAHDAHRLPRADPPLRPPGAPPDAAQDDPGRAPPLRLLPRAGQGAHAGARARAPARPARCSKRSGRRWAPASRPRRRSTRWRSTCSATRPRAASSVREIDGTIAEIPGLEGLTLLEDYLDGALAGRPSGRAGPAWPAAAASRSQTAPARRRRPATLGDGP